MKQKIPELIIVEDTHIDEKEVAAAAANDPGI